MTWIGYCHTLNAVLLAVDRGIEFAHLIVNPSRKSVIGIVRDGLVEIYKWNYAFVQGKRCRGLIIADHRELEGAVAFKKISLCKAWIIA